MTTTSSTPTTRRPRTFTAVYPEHNSKRQNPRWVAVFKTHYGCDHEVLPLNVTDDSKEEAEAYARALDSFVPPAPSPEAGVTFLGEAS